MNVPNIAFVGREDEIKRFREAIDGPRYSQRMMYLHGPGGLGKTRLIEQYQRICSSEHVPYTQVIDFYETANQFSQRVQHRLIVELTAQVESVGGNPSDLRLFEDFKAEFQELERLEAEGCDPGKATEQKGHVDNLFLDDYNRLAQWFAEKNRPIVLFFDTFEAIRGYGELGSWLLWRFVPKISNTVVVLAGRDSLPIDLPMSVGVQEVGPLTVKNIGSYFEQRDILLPDTDTSFERILQLTEGSPLLVTLVADWMLGNPGADPAELLGSGDVNEATPRGIQTATCQCSFAPGSSDRIPGHLVHGPRFPSVRRFHTGLDYREDALGSRRDHPKHSPIPLRQVSPLL